jgi:hypothetical protein
VAVTWDGISTWSIYINGNRSARDSEGTGTYSGTSPIYIGRQGSACNCNFFDGLMDEVRVWSAMRTQAQIQQNMCRSLVGNELDLYSYYRMDEGSGTTITNSAIGTGGYATLSGGAGGPSWVPGRFTPAITNTQPITLNTDSATLQARVNPSAQATFWWLEYGLTAAYGGATPIIGIGGGSSDVIVQASLTNLTQSTLYHWRVAATNYSGTNYSTDQTFTTAGPPVATTGSALMVVDTSAYLSGSVNPGGLSGSAWLEYGTDTNYGSVSLKHSISGFDPFSFTNLIDALAPGTLYHYRAVATNSAGTSLGGDQAFSTTPIAWFGRVPSAFPAGVGGTAAAWGDFDNDGRPDVILSGTSVPGSRRTQLWHNTASGFTNVTTQLTQLRNSTVAWGDFNNDGLLDVVIAGSSSTGLVTQVWLNTGTDFTNMNAALTGVSVGTFALGDFDNDGRLDIALIGTAAGSVPVTQVWRNTGNGFTNINAGLPGVSSGSIAWGDFDNDGRLDLLICGSGITGIWRNTGNGFSNINAGLTAIYDGKAVWGDFDNDGRLDVTLVGQTFSGTWVTEIWRNTDSGFTNIHAGLPLLSPTTVAWGDFDNDGKLDLLIAGQPQGETLPWTLQIWHNTGIGFSLATRLASDMLGWANLADFDGDGSLDVLVYGIIYQTGALAAELYHNQAPATNTPPTAPTPIGSTVSGGAVTLTWNPATDAQTPSPGLSYNVRIGSSPGGSDILAPAANAATGLRQIVERGNAQANLFKIINGLAPGTYYWAVQAIDTSFAGSAFSTEQQFTIIPPHIDQISPQPGNTILLQCSGAPATAYTLLSSSNLVDWTVLTNLTADGAGSFQFTTTNPANQTSRFFRLRWP